MLLTVDEAAIKGLCHEHVIIPPWFPLCRWLTEYNDGDDDVVGDGGRAKCTRLKWT